MSDKTKGSEKGITRRQDDFSAWYLDVISKAELADYAPVKGCMVIRPNGYALWENIQRELDRRFKETGHKNAYFPLFIPESFMRKESEHVEGFAPHCAVVTHGGGEKLAEPFYIRPTSEAIIGHMFSKWIQSYRDLPLLINQWANVVRWELRTRLFLRTLEFLWQEGHTVHETEAEAEKETLTILDLYADFAEKVMAMPVIKGRKSEDEKFAGALRTYSIEAMMQDRKALQAGTSHNLGQNFAKAFNIQFQDRAGNLQFAWTTSWGVSTRLVGALIMTHSDDKGLVVPPKLAPNCVCVIPIYRKDEERATVLEVANRLHKSISKSGISAQIDSRENLTPGAKYFEHESKGVPIRIEIGPRDIAAGKCVLVRRDTGEKITVSLDDADKSVLNLVDEIQNSLYTRSKEFFVKNTTEGTTYDNFKSLMKEERGGGFHKGGWCGQAECEKKMAEETKATIRCIPFDQPSTQGKCLRCGSNGQSTVIYAKAY